MELYTLKAFMTVAAERSFSRAGERLNRSQSAITQAVQKLEREFGEQLLDRTARDLTLTDSGRLILGFCRRFESLERELWDAYSELRDVAAGRLLIGANEATAPYLLPHLMQYRERYPKVKIHVRRSCSARVATHVVDGELEFGVVSGEVNDTRLDTCLLRTDRMALVVAPKHELAALDEVSLERLSTQTVIVNTPPSPYQAVIAEAFERAQLDVRADIELPTLDAICQMAEAGQGVGVLPHEFVRADIERGALRELNVPALHMARKIWLVYPSCRVLSHAGKAFLYMVSSAGTA